MRKKRTAKKTGHPKTRKYSIQPGQKRKGGCLKYFLFVFFALVAIGSFVRSGDGASADTAEAEMKTHSTDSTPAIVDAVRSESLASEPDSEPSSSQFEVYYLDVDQGDASLVICDGHAMLIDGGKASQSDKIYAVLKNKGLQALDYIVATHPDDDHVGGLAGALNYASAETALAPVKTDESESFQNFEKYLGRQGLSITVPENGSEFMLGSATVQVLGPVKLSDIDNDNSLVLRISHHDNAFLFTGDAERGEENDILDSGADIRSTVLKIAHHGSSSSTSTKWLNAIDPDFAVISCGADNAYGHPTEKVLGKLKKKNLSVFRTDLQGDIRFYEEDGRLLHEVEKNQDADVFVPGYVAENESSQNNGNEVQPLTADTQSQDDAVTRSGNTDTSSPANIHDYIVNTNTGKFHYPTCRSVKQMKEKNKQYVTCERQELIDRGYESCGNCHP